MAFEVPPPDRWTWMLEADCYRGTAVVDYPFIFEMRVFRTATPCFYRLVTSATVSGVAYVTEQRCDVFIPSLTSTALRDLVIEYSLIREAVEKAQHTISQVQQMIDHPPNDRK